MWTWAKWIGIIGLALVVGIIGVTLFMDWNWAKGRIARAASNAIGQTVTIAGNVDVDLWSRTPRLRAEDVQIDNVEWGQEPYLLTLGSITLRMNLWQLLQGHIVFAEIKLLKPVAALERSPSGALNWAALGTSQSNTEASSPATLPAVKRLDLQDGRMTYHDASRQTSVVMTLPTLTAFTRETEQTLVVQGHGKIAEEPFQFHLTTAPLDEMQAAGSVPLQAQLQVGDMPIRFDGTITRPFQQQALEGQVIVAEAPPDALFNAFGMSLSSPESFHLQGQLSHQANVSQLQKMEMRLGESRLTGSVTIDRATERPFLKADLTSERLVVQEFTSLFPTSHTEPSSSTSKASTSQTFFPQVSVSPEQLRAVDGELKFYGKTVMTTAQTLHDVSLTAQLHNAHLVLNPKFAMAGGNVQGRLEVDGRQQPIHSTVQAEIDKVDLHKVMAAFGSQTNAFGPLSGHTDLTGQGHTLKAFMNTVAGEVVLLMSRGRLDQLLVELLGLDVAGIITSFFAGKNETVPIRCAVADFAVAQGRLETQTLIISTRDSKITGSGFIDVGRQQVDLRLQPQEKDLSAFSADAPIQIQGSFGNLSVSTNVGEALLSLATPVELGTAEAANCQELLQEARQP